MTIALKITSQSEYLSKVVCNSNGQFDASFHEFIFGQRLFRVKSNFVKRHFNWPTKAKKILQMCQLTYYFS